MKGTYNIVIGGKSYECENVITEAGRIAMLRAISGQKAGWAESIVAGVGETAASDSDTDLVFSVTGGDINATIIDPINEKLYFKTSLPLQDEVTIYELGCYASNTLTTQSSESGGGSLILILSGNTAWTDVDGSHTLDTTNARVDGESISYTIAASDAATGYASFVSDLSFVPDAGRFKLAYYCDEISTLTVRFKVDDSNYFESSAWSVAAGYNVDSVLKSAFTATGAPSWTGIQTLEFEIAATATGGQISLDALRYELPVSEESNLLSRVVLPEPQIKLPGVPVDVEYVLEI